MRLIPLILILLFQFIAPVVINASIATDTVSMECTPKNQYMPVGGSCCDGLIPQKEGFKVKCMEEESWFNWKDFFLGLAIPFLVFAYIAIFVKRKQKQKS